MFQCWGFFGVCIWFFCFGGCFLFVCLGFFVYSPEGCSVSDVPYIPYYFKTVYNARTSRFGAFTNAL